MKNLNEDEIEHLMAQISINNSFYDTIYFVVKSGTGVLGNLCDGRRHQFAEKMQKNSR